MKIKLVPAHWLKIEPIPLGDSQKLFVTVLVRMTSQSAYLGITSDNTNHLGPKPEFEFPGFNKASDIINTHLMQQI